MTSPKSVATSSTGFFQESPPIVNQYLEDASLRHASLLFLPDEVLNSIYVDLKTFGQRVLSTTVLSYLKNAEQHPPQLETWDTWGRRKDELITSEGWRQLQATGIREGIVAIPYEEPVGPYSRLYQFLKYHLWSASSALVTCPSAMTDGAAALLRRHIDQPASADLQAVNRAALQSAYDRLTSRDSCFAWTSGQWMTERPGGSEVKNTETHATLHPSTNDSTTTSATDGSPLGPWLIHGFKWFSSATDADMTVLLAKTPSADSQTHDQISAFFAPTRYQPPNSTTPVFNGIRPHRLKRKLGTRPLPTAELELVGLRSHMLGAPGQGVREIATVLNITRIHNAVAAMGGWGRGLAISRSFARVRHVGGRLLMEVPAHARDLAEEHVKYRAYMLLTYFVVGLLGVVEYAGRHGGEFRGFMGMESVREAEGLLRLLTPVLKAGAALAAISGLRWCMESLGGVGYLENDEPELNVARLFRDANVLAIWEGTTNVMAEDVVRVLGSGKEAPGLLGSFTGWSRRLREDSRIRDDEKLSAVLDAVQFESVELSSKLRKGSQVKEMLYSGRKIMDSIEFIVTSILLVEDAARNKSNPVASEIARRWIVLKGRYKGKDHLKGLSLTEVVRLDASILAEYKAPSEEHTKAKI